MAKNISLVLLGFIIGAATIRAYYGPSRSPAPSDFSRSTGAIESERVRRPRAEEVQFGVEREAEAGGSSVTVRAITQTPINSENESPGSAADIAPGLPAEQGTGRDPSQRESDSAADAASETTLPPLLPEEYYSMVEPPSRRALALDELVTRFAGEPRDESWAYTMELGINQHIADSSALKGAVVEYVECRTTACVMAGWVQPGMEDGSPDLINEMSQTGWWQLAPIHTSRGSNDDGTQRFVRIIPRTREDLFVEVPSEPSRQEDSTTQSLTSKAADT